MPTAVTNGAAHGSSINPARSAIARDAATAVAVAPTPDERSQVSSSVRAIGILPIAAADRRRCLAYLTSQPWPGLYPRTDSQSAWANC